VAIACTHCGHDLPRDDSHFCNNCGMLVPSHPFSAQSLAAASSAAAPPREQEKPVLREQMVHRPVQKPVMQEQMAQRPRTTRRIAPDNSSTSSVAWPAPMTHVSVKDSSARKQDERIIQQEQHPMQQNGVQQPVSSERELHVKVWEQEHTNPPTPLPESKAEVAHSDIPLPLSPAEQRGQGQHTPVPYSSMPLQPVRTVQPPSQYPNMQTSQSSVREKRGANAIPALSTTVRPQKSRIPFIVLLALLGLLVLGGGAWAILAQPFSISSVTQPLQDFKDTHLGVALSYPNSWSVQHSATGVLFSDSSHTAQVKLTVADGTSDTAQYVQQQATKNGMTAIKPLGTRSFAGASWQQIQGNMQQDGANYTTTMLATVHGNHMYVLTQMAPQNVYTDEDSVVFSAMRNSFTLL